MANLSRSPSLIQARSGSPLRKSADLSPYAPKFSSPSDSPKRSFGLKHFPSEKENQQDPVASKSTKGKSPAMASSPNVPPFQKNFMAPTISASSKAVNPSAQRKRVLGEKNEALKFSQNSAPTEVTAGPAVRFALSPTVVEDITSCTDKSCFSSPIKEGISLSVHDPANKDSSWVRAKTTIQPNQFQSELLPPYDPKVNYLSPRPRFLHYKPRPQASLSENELDVHDMDYEAKSLEDRFSSEGSEDAISVQTEEEDGLSEEATLTQMESPKLEAQPNRVKTMRGKLKVGHLFSVLFIGCICLPFSDTPMMASYSNPKVPPITYVGFNTRILEASNKFSGWFLECFTYPFAREVSFPREMNTLNTSPMANFTCMVDDNRSSADDVKSADLDSWGEVYKRGISSEDNETHAIFEMAHGENEVLEIQTRYEIEDIEEKEKEEIVADASSTSQQLEMSSDISKLKGGDSKLEKKVEKYELEKLENSDTKVMENQEVNDLQPTMTENTKPENKLEKSEPEKPESQEPELVDNNAVNDLVPIMMENLEQKLIEPESSHMPDEDLIKISKRAAQGMASVAVLMSLVTLVALGYSKRKQNHVLVSDMTSGDKKPGMNPGSSESHVPNRMSLHPNSTLDVEFSSSSFEVGTISGAHTSTPRERKVRRESEASSGSYGSYLSFEKISSKKGKSEAEEITPVRRSSRLRNLTISSTE